jgi:hypothetical protein
MNPEQAEHTRTTIKMLQHRCLDLKITSDSNCKDKNIILNSYNIIIAELEKLTNFYKTGTFV